MCALALLAVALVHPRIASAQINVTPPELNNVDIVEHLDGPLPREAIFRDTTNRAVRLGEYFDGKRPTLLVFAYHTCPMLCSMVLDATVRALREIPWTVGKEFDLVSVSIDPRDTPESAVKKRDEVVAKYGREGSAAGFHFLVGDERMIRMVSDAVGFRFRYDERQGQYAHPAAIYLVTPTGLMARYLYGIQYEPSDLRLGLLEASQGRSISTVERLILYCYHYDPAGKHYAIMAMRVMRVGGVLTMLFLGSLLATLWLRERRRWRLDAAAPPSPNPHAPRPSTNAT